MREMDYICFRDETQPVSSVAYEEVWPVPATDDLLEALAGTRAHWEFFYAYLWLAFLDSQGAELAPPPRDVCEYVLEQ